MALTVWAFDILLGSGLLVLAVGIIRSERLYKAVIMFMVFGLLSALTWARLHATDIALAEAAIGAGVTGALFLSTLGRIDALSRLPRKNEENGHAE